MSSRESLDRTVLLNVVLAAAYVLCGRAGLLLAVPPGYATAIFPSAGIAVGAMYAFGACTLPATVAGSFLLNLWIGTEAGHGFGAAAANAVVIAAGSGVQAAIGGTILRRSIGYPSALDNIADIAALILLAPAICLISTTLSLSCLWLIGSVSSGDFWPSWTTWWIGDTLGVLIALPLLLTVAGEPRALWRRRVRSLALPMLLFFALFVAIFVQVSAWEQDQSLAEFRLESQKLSDNLRFSMDELGIVLDQLKAGFSNRQTGIAPRNFTSLASVLLERFPTIQAVEWAPRITTKNARAVESPIAPPVIRERNPAGGMRVAGVRSEYFPVAYIVPLAGNEAALGFDLASDSVRRAAIGTAVATGRIAASAPVRLVQARGDQSGILIVDDVSSGPTGPGVLLIVLRMSRFVQSVLNPLSSDLDVRVADVGTAVPLFENLSNAPQPELGLSFRFGGRAYVIHTSPTLLYVKQHRGWQSWLLLVVGMFCTGLLGAFLMLGTGQSWRFESLLEQRTHDLKQSHDQLKRETAEREQAQTALGQAKRMQAIGQLTGGIAHDFNNLLMVVTGSVERLHKEMPGQAAAKYLDMIRAAAHRGQGLTRQLLSFAQLRPLNPRLIDICAATRSTADMIRLSLRGDIEVRTELPDGICSANLDPAEYELALLNLAVNARDAMPKGGVLTIAVARAEGNNAVKGIDGACLAIKVADTGIGIAPDILPRVFEPYFTTKATGTGTGLGLSQVYGFVKQSAGAVDIASTPGSGTTVTLFLPAAGELPSATSAARYAAVRSTAKRNRALLVEDDGDVANILETQLNELGYEVETVASGQAALDMIARKPEFDILVSDILMPGGISGIELARRLRLSAAGIPALLVTGYSGNDVDPAGEGFAVLRKPFETQDLAEAIAQLLAPAAADTSSALTTMRA